MANTNGSFGLRPIGMVGNERTTMGVSEYRIAHANASKLYNGMPVIPLASGMIDLAGGAEGGTVGILGSFDHCEYVSIISGKPVWSNYWPGSDANTGFPVRAFVHDHPLQTFVIASDASLTDEDTARAHVFANFDFSTCITGTDATGLSLGRLAVSTVATTNTLNMRLMGFVEDADNWDWTAAGVGCIVRLNNHFNSPNGAAAGGTVSNTGV